ncbi:hypothetical protein FRC17_007438 [Serendipita sp. 399]|nr:hypothetical protein FRC17_007438 [Serendipita sp. 399]
MGQGQSTSSSVATTVGSAGGVLINSAASILKNATTAPDLFSKDEHSEERNTDSDASALVVSSDSSSSPQIRDTGRRPPHRQRSSTDTGVSLLNYPGSDTSYPVSSILFIGSSQPCSPGVYHAAVAAAAAAANHSPAVRTVWSPSGHSSYALKSAGVCCDRSTTKSVLSPLSINEEDEDELEDTNEPSLLDFQATGDTYSAPPEDEYHHPTLGLEKPSDDIVILVDDSSPVDPDVWRDTINLVEQTVGDVHSHNGGDVQLQFLPNSNDGRTAPINRMVPEADQSSFSRDVLAKPQMSITEKLDELIGEYFMNLRNNQQSMSIHPSESGSNNSEMIQSRRAVYNILLHTPPVDDPEPILIFVAKSLDAGRFPLNQLQIRFIQVGTDPKVTETVQRMTTIAQRHNVRQIVQAYTYSK